MMNANMAYGRGSYIEILKLIRDLCISSTAAEPMIKMLYIAPTMAIHSRMRMAEDRDALREAMRCKPSSVVEV
jgi:hypothetical protein